MYIEEMFQAVINLEHQQSGYAQVNFEAAKPSSAALAPQTSSGLGPIPTTPTGKIVVMGLNPIPTGLPVQFPGATTHVQYPGATSGQFPGAPALQMPGVPSLVLIILTYYCKLELSRKFACCCNDGMARPENTHMCRWSPV